jgi:hypothetical protein
MVLKFQDFDVSVFQGFEVSGILVSTLKIKIAYISQFETNSIG